MVARDTPDAAATSSTVVLAIPRRAMHSYAPREHLEAGVVHRSCASSAPAAQSPSSGSRPTVSPGRSPTACTASSTPGMNDVRS